MPRSCDNLRLRRICIGVSVRNHSDSIEVTFPEAWVGAYRKGFPIYGVRYSLTPGAGALVKLLDDKGPYLTWAFPIVRLLDGGLNLQDGLTHFSSPTGVSWLSDKSALLLQPGEAAWVPAGHLFVAATLNGSPVGTLLFQPVWEKTSIMNVGSRCVAAMDQWYHEEWKKLVGKSTAWADLQAAWKSFRPTFTP